MMAAYFTLEVTHAASGAAASDARFAFCFTSVMQTDYEFVLVHAGQRT